MKYIAMWVLSVFVLCASTLSVSAQTNLTDGDPSNDNECVSLKTLSIRFGARDASTDGEVTVLQDFLISKGMLSGQPTGYYGRLTVMAVKAYQRSVGVSPTGNVGPLTKSLIEKETCSGSQVSVTQPVTTTKNLNTYPAITNISASSPSINYFKVSETAVRSGQEVKISWVASNAINCNLIHTENNVSTADGVSIGTASSYTIYPTATASYNLYCFGSSDGKTTLSAEKLFKVTVIPSTGEQGSMNPGAANVSATIDDNSGQGSLDAEPSKRTFTFYGKATGISSLGLVISNGGGKIYGSGAGAIPVVNGQYIKVLSVNELNLVAGTYTATIYSNDNVLLAKKEFIVKDTIPTCSLTQTSPQPPFTYPINVLVGWSSTNATYGISPSGDKINPNGSLYFDLKAAENKLLNFKFYNAFGESGECQVLLSSMKG